MSFHIPKQLQILGQDIEDHQLKYHHKDVLVSKEFTFDSAHHFYLW